MPLVVTGSIGIDTVHTPTASADQVLGGSCTYFAAGAAFFAPVRLVAAVGGDFDPNYLGELKAFPNIDLRGLERRPESKTFRWTGRYHEDLNRRDTVEVNLGVLGEPAPKPPAAFRDSEFVFLANDDPVTQLAHLESFPNRRLVVADTMDLWITTKRDELEALLRSIDGIIINDAESELMTEDSNIVRASRKIREAMDLTFVLTKKGEHGAILIHKGGMAALPAFPVENVIDPTGAGDSFAGGLMGFLASIGRTDFQAIQAGMTHGTIISSFTIEAFSLDRLRQIGEPEIHKRMIQFAQAVRVI